MVVEQVDDLILEEPLTSVPCASTLGFPRSLYRHSRKYASFSLCRTRVSRRSDNTTSTADRRPQTAADGTYVGKFPELPQLFLAELDGDGLSAGIIGGSDLAGTGRQWSPQP